MGGGGGGAGGRRMSCFCHVYRFVGVVAVWGVSVDDGAVGREVGQAGLADRIKVI